MTVILTEGNGYFDIAAVPMDDFGAYVVGDEFYRSEACYAGLWNKPVIRQEWRDSWVRVVVNLRDGDQGHGSHMPVTPGYARTLLMFVIWLNKLFRSCSFYLINTSAYHREFPIYAIEVRWSAETTDSELFTALNFVRFCGHEFTLYADNVEDLTPREFMAAIFAQGKVYMNLHMPFQDYHNIFGENGGAKPRVSADFGHCFADWADQTFPTRNWEGRLVHSPGSLHKSNVWTKEFHPYWAEWKKNKGIKPAKPEDELDDEEIMRQAQAVLDAYAANAALPINPPPVIEQVQPAVIDQAQVEEQRALIERDYQKALKKGVKLKKLPDNALPPQIVIRMEGDQLDFEHKPEPVNLLQADPIEFARRVAEAPEQAKPKKRKLAVPDAPNPVLTPLKARR